jgi:hypothetical protein
MPKYLLTKDAAEMLGVDHKWLWDRAGKKLTPPLRPSPKRAYWLSGEIIKLKEEAATFKKLIEA